MTAPVARNVWVPAFFLWDIPVVHVNVTRRAWVAQLKWQAQLQEERVRVGA
jgi:hypothetical protein